MSYMWGAIKTEEPARLSGAIFMGIFVSLFIGVPIILATNYYKINIPIWTGILFIIIVFPIVTVITYKSARNKKSKK